LAGLFPLGRELLNKIEDRSDINGAGRLRIDGMWRIGVRLEYVNRESGQGRQFQAFVIKEKHIEDCLADGDKIPLSAA